jgi:hypothetical protein
MQQEEPITEEQIAAQFREDLPTIWFAAQAAALDDVELLCCLPIEDMTKLADALGGLAERYGDFAAGLGIISARLRDLPGKRITSH